jgi:uncharacterized GH25 family protein
MRQKPFTLLATILILSFGVSAHDTWLTSKQPTVQPGSSVWLDLTSGMSFPLLDTSIKPDRVDVARCRLNGKTDELTDSKSAPKALTLRALLKDEGVATCWVELKSRQLELTPSQVEEYFKEIDATPAVRQAWLNTKAPKRWRESYVKHAKTFVAAGSKKDKSWSESVGMTLEIVPETDPTSLRAGDDFVVRVVKDGQPFRDFRVGIVFQGNRDIGFQTTDDNGRVTFRLKRSGNYLLRATDLRQSTKPDLGWESDFTTLTIQTLSPSGIRTRKLKN